jgi:DNA-binding LytR/AlgR family response regulator
MAALWAVFVAALAALYVALRLATGRSASLVDIAPYLLADGVIAVGVGWWLLARARRWAGEARPVGEVVRTLVLWSVIATAAMSVLIASVALARSDGPWQVALLAHVAARWPGALIDLGFLWAIAVSVVPVPYLKTQHDRLTAPPPATKPQARIAVRNGRGDVFVPVDAVLAVTAAENYVELHCAGRSHLHRATLAQMEALLGPPDFMRVHRGAIVRLSAVAAVNRPKPNHVELALDSGRTVGVGRAYRSAVLAALKETVRHRG